MTTKKTLLTIVAVVLICALSVAGTLAYLSKNTEVVTNTFLSAGDLIDGELMLKEREVQTDVVGDYFTEVDDYATYQADDSTEWVDGIDYDKVLPGQVIPKKATVMATQVNEDAPSYLYIEVVDNSGDYLTWALDADMTMWTKLDGVTGMNGGVVYLYNAGANKLAKANNLNAEQDDNDLTVDFNATVTVAHGANGYDDVIDGAVLEINAADNLIKYYAYMAQASAGDTPAEAYTTCFPNT